MCGFYRKLFCLAFALLLLPGIAFSDRIGLLNSEGDGAPDEEYAYKVVWPNGTIAIVNGELTYTPAGGAGTGDVTAVGDCASGDCGDGTSDGGTYYRLYDGTANYLQLAVSGALGGDLTLNLDTLLTTGSPSFAAVTATGASGVDVGVASTTLGLITLQNNATANAFSIFPGATGVGVGWRLPIAAPGGANYLLNVDADGTMDYTDPATFVPQSLFDAQTILAATADNTPAALTITEQTVVGRATGGNIAAIAIDSDLATVSASDDTVPSAKAAKAYIDAAAVAPTNVTPVDTADEDATFYPLLVDGATGSQATETDNEFSYNPSTGVLTVPALGAHTTGVITVADGGILAQTGTGDADYFSLAAYDLDGAAYQELVRPVASNTPHLELGPATNFVKVSQVGLMTFEGTADIDLPASSVDAADIGTTSVYTPTASKAAGYTVGTDDAKESYGGVIYVTSAATIQLPAIAAGMSVSVITIGATAVSVDTNASDRMYLDGVALDDGDKATNTSTTGDMLVCTYESAAGWYCASGSPDGDHWTDGGP